MKKRLGVLGVEIGSLLIALIVLTACNGGGGVPGGGASVTPAIEPPTAPAGSVGVPYNLSFRWTTNVAKPPYFWSLIGSMPPGTAFNAANGLIAGTPTTPGSYAFTVVVRDSNNPQKEETKAYTIVIAGPAGGALTLTPVPAGLPDCKVGVPYSFKFMVTGGLSPYSFAVEGMFIPGLIFEQGTGKLVGTPTTTGQYTFTVRVFDSQVPPNSDAETYTLECIDPLQITTLAPLPPAEVGVAYSQQLGAKGGVPCPGGPGVYAWVLESGPFPPGLTLSASGLISGTPTSPGTYDFLARVTDCDTPTPETVTRNLSITVNLVEADRFLCVDGFNGDDAAGDGTSALPFKSITRALAYTSANNLNPSLPRIGAIRIAGSQGGPPLLYHESVTLDAAALVQTNISLLGGYDAFCATRGTTINAEIKALRKGLDVPAIRVQNGVAGNVVIEQLRISGDNATTSGSSLGIEVLASSPRIAKNIIHGGNPSGNATSFGIVNYGGSSPLIVENEIYGGLGGMRSWGIFNRIAGTNPEIRDNRIDGGDPTGGGLTLSSAIMNMDGASANIYDNNRVGVAFPGTGITGGTGIGGARGISVGGYPTSVGATIARNTIDCEGSLFTAVCAAVDVEGTGSNSIIKSNSINATAALGLSTRGVSLYNSASATIVGHSGGALAINGGQGSVTSYGILMESGATATIGGPASGERNIISGDGCTSIPPNSYGIKLTGAGATTISTNNIAGGCGTVAVGIGVDPSSPTILNNTVTGSISPFTNLDIGIQVSGAGSAPTITNNTVTGGWGFFTAGLWVDSSAAPAGITGNTLTGALGLFTNDEGQGLHCEGASIPSFTGNTVNGGGAVTNSFGAFFENCTGTIGGGAFPSNTITGDASFGWSAGINSGGSSLTVTNNAIAAGTGLLFSTGAYFANANPVLTGNRISAGSSPGAINDGLVLSNTGGSVRSSTLNGNGGGGLNAYAARTLGCTSTSFGPAGGNIFMGTSGAGWNFSNEDEAVSVSCPGNTINVVGNTWDQAPPPGAGLVCGPASDANPPRNWSILNAGRCLQF